MTQTTSSGESSSLRVSRVKPRAWRPPSVGMVAAYILIVLGALFCLIPFWMMLVYGTQSAAEIFTLPPPLWFGDDFLENTKRLTETVPFFRNLWNSFYIAILATTCTLFFCSLAGFAFAMYEFKFRELLFSIVMATMTIPAFLNIVPTYKMLNAIGWLNHPIALWLPGAAGAFGIFLMRQYIGGTVPKDLLEAARIDGCDEFGLYWRVVLPLSRPAMGTLGLVSFIGAWNNLQGSLIVMQSKETFTVQHALNAMKGAYNTDWGGLFAGTLLAVVPLLILFVIFSKQLIEGLTAGSVKG
jgi:multiple sugar transport system permease protein